MGKRSRKVVEKEEANKASISNNDDVILEPVISSDEPPLKQVRRLAVLK